MKKIVATDSPLGRVDATPTGTPLAGNLTTEATLWRGRSAAYSLLRMGHQSILRTFDRVAPIAPDQCPDCGAPSLRGRVTLILRGNEQLAVCTNCDGYIDRDGAPVGRLWNGKLHYKVIRLEDVPAAS